MKRRYSVDEILRNPFTEDQIANFRDKGKAYNNRQEFLAKGLTLAFTPTVILLLFIAHMLVSTNFIKIPNDSSVNLFYFIGILFILSISVGMMMSIYFSYTYHAAPLQVVMNRDSRCQYDLEIDEDTFKKCKNIDISKINQIEKSKAFYNEIVNVQKRPMYNFEYTIMEEMYDRIQNI